jgi:hypothetical protein
MTSGAASYRQIAPDTLEIREGGGCLSLFGVPFFLAGCFVTLIGLGVVPVRNAADLPRWAWPLIVTLGLAFVAVGGGLVFGRRWIVLDTGRSRVTKRWGLLIPFRTEGEHPLQDYDAVVLRFEAGDSDSADTFPVALRKRDGGADLRLSSSTAYENSRQAAAQVARFLAFPLVDAATDHEIIVDADRADAALADRARRAQGAADRPARPLRMRSQVQESATQVRIIIPGSGFRVLSLLGIVIPVGILSYAAPALLEFFDQTHTPPAVQIAFLGFLVLFFGLVPIFGSVRSLIAGVRGHTRITASPDGLAIEEQGAWRVHRSEFPAKDILDLDYGTAGDAADAVRRTAERKASEAGARISATTRNRALRWAVALSRTAKSNGITAKTRRGLFTFGAGLPDDEIRYLHGMMREALIGERDLRW